MSKEFKAVKWKNSFGEVWYLIYDPACNLYRTGAEWDGTFAWARDKAAAARFPSRDEAELCIADHENGQDTVRDHAGQMPDPEDVVYGMKWGKPPIPVSVAGD